MNKKMRACACVWCGGCVCGAFLKIKREGVEKLR